MAQATPLDVEPGAMADPGSAAPAARDAAGAPAGTPTGVYFDGLPMVGTFVQDGKPLGGNTYCTGSVVRSKGKALILTAGHCANGLASAGHRIFSNGAAMNTSSTCSPAPARASSRDTGPGGGPQPHRASAGDPHSGC
ncbi:hypothetical protein [Streptomyces sp. NPDC049949]|uniref:hypothetical protein n=1 Tax=Streptomyces sp. NPDC049949 TaxID=3154627 RepID=UPI003446254B